MGRKDTKDRPFFSDERRFAELINHNVYRGEKMNICYGLEIETESNYSMPEQVIAVHLNMKGLVQKMDKENKPMCKAVQDWIEDERNKGRREGIKEGKKEEKLQIIRRMQEKGLEESFIRQMTKCTKAEFVAAAGR